MTSRPDASPDDDRPGSPVPDPTLVTAQPALTRSTGRRWLIWGGVLAAVAVVVLAALTTVHAPVAVGGLVAVILVYAAMVVARVTIASLHTRLRALAWLTGVLAVVAVLAIVVVAWAVALGW